GAPSPGAEASPPARSRPACPGRHAARQTRASPRRSRRAVWICSLIGGPAQRAGSPARAALGLSARGSGTALPAPSACLPGIRGVVSSARVARRPLASLAGGQFDAGPVVAREEGQDFADGAFPAGGFGQGQVRLDLVAVAAAVLLLDEVAGCGQVGDDAVGAALGDVQ